MITFTRTPNPNPVPDEQVAEHLANPGFGKYFTDHMVTIDWDQEHGWHNAQVTAHHNLELPPATSVLHYGQAIFEGIKAYRQPDGSIKTFRPEENAARFQRSANRLAMPELPADLFIESLRQIVDIAQRWVPAAGGEAALYLRPFAFASEAFLGVRPAAVVDYYVIASPAGSYFPHGLEPVSIWVTTEYHRAGRGGTGAAKTGGNYASSLLPQQEAYAQGCDQVCFLDDVSQENIEELGGMNLMVVDADGTVRTPRLTGTILEGCTRSAIIRLLRDSGRNVVEETISLQGLLADIESGRVSEVFACGTAAVVVPLGHLKGEGFDARIEGSEVTRQIHDRLTAIQTGRAEDPYGWMYQLVPPRS